MSRGEPQRHAAAGSTTSPALGVVDLHVDIPWQVHFKGRAATLEEGHGSLKNLRRGGYVGLIFPIYLPDGPHGEGPPIDTADAVFHTIEAILKQNDAFLALDAREAKRGLISPFLAIEGAGAFARDVRQIDRFLGRGLRLVSPCHGKNGPLASSATGSAAHHGLTPLGKEFCERVYGGGALIDVSHVSDRSFSDIAEIALRHEAPIVATHSNARAVAAHPRNLTDDQLRAIRQTGGVAGVNFHSPYVNGSSDSTLDDLLKQVERMVRIAGKDHVAIGSDFDGGITPPAELSDAGAFPRLASALRASGMPDADILQIFSLNALRVLGVHPLLSIPATPP